MTRGPQGSAAPTKGGLFQDSDVTAGRDEGVADRGDAALQAPHALRPLFSGADLSVIQCVFLPHGQGREVGHHDVGACRQAQFPAVGLDRPQGRGGGEEQVGLDEA